MNADATIVADFRDFSAFILSLRTLKEAGFEQFSVYSPVSIEDFEDEMPEKGSTVPWWSLGAGFTGAFLGFLMAVGSASLYGLIVGGAPWKAWIPYCVVGFEVTILTSALVTLGVVIVKSRLYPRTPRFDYEGHFSSDVFGVSVPCNRGQCGEIIELLSSSGASDIREI